MFAPAGIAPPVLNKLNADLVRVLLLPEIKDLFAGQGAQVVGNSADQFNAMVKSEVAKWARVIKETGIHIE